MICKNCGKELPEGAQTCPYCGEAVNAAPAVQPRPTVTVIAPAPQEEPPKQPKQQKAPKPRRSKMPTAARVFTVILSLLAVGLNISLTVLWFLPSIPGTATHDPNSMTLYSLRELCMPFAPWLSITVALLCAVSAIFCLAPLFPALLGRRKALFVPKVLTVLCGACYAVLFVYPTLAEKMAAQLGGERLYHSNLYTVGCLVLFVLLFIISELTIADMRAVYEGQIERLEKQLRDNGIEPTD